MIALDRARDRIGRWVPRWWAGEGGVAGAVLDPLLWPAELIYRGVLEVRNRAYDRGWRKIERASIPVVSVGNIGVGGAGKTPVAAWLAGRLLQMGHRPAIVMRGYGRDELLVHRELNPAVPVCADPHRLAAVNAAARAGCDVGVLDDGFQHRRLARDLDVLLVSAESWQVARRSLPRGPWRERLNSARRADIAIVTRKSAGEAEVAAVSRALMEAAPDLPLLRCRIAPAELIGLSSGIEAADEFLRGRSVLAVAALAFPRPFVENLRSVGAEVELAAFSDHHEFTAEDAVALVRSAAGRALIMTLKDAVKLRELLPPSIPAYVLRQRVEFETGEDVVDAALRVVVEGKEK
jgi:tetraacyldisaccharide 4'-kinase